MRDFLKSARANFDRFFACDFSGTGVAMRADLGVNRA
jgi:hypothetical protein